MKIASTVKIAPDGVDALLDLVGTSVIEDSFSCVRRGGVLCIAGLLGGEWEIANFVLVLPSHRLRNLHIFLALRHLCQKKA